MKEKCIIHTSGIVPYWDDSIWLQIRGSNSKTGEKLAFWGGHQNPGETALQTAIREGKEELKYHFRNLLYLSTTDKDRGDHVIRESTYMVIAPLESCIEIREGKGLWKGTVDQARHLRMNPGDNLILDKVQQYLKQQNPLKFHVPGIDRSVVRPGVYDVAA